MRCPLDRSRTLIALSQPSARLPVSTGFMNKKHDLKGYLSDLVQLWPNHTVPRPRSNATSMARACATRVECDTTWTLQGLRGQQAPAATIRKWKGRLWGDPTYGTVTDTQSQGRYNSQAQAACGVELGLRAQSPPSPPRALRRLIPRGQEGGSRRRRPAFTCFSFFSVKLLLGNSVSVPDLSALS